MNLSLTNHSRSRTLLFIMCAVGAVFVVRLFYLQVMRHDYYDTEALREHTTKFTLPAQRGEIYARDGGNAIAPLVMNEASYIVYADPRYVTDEHKVADVLRQVAGGNVVDNFEDGLKNKDLQYTVLARQISQKQADLINQQKLSGVGMQEQDKRVYPEGALAAQVLGYVNSDGKGQYGIEQALNSDLSGTAGQLKAVTDVRGIPLSVGDNVETPPQDGKNIVLSIDRNIQSYVEQALKEGLDKVHAAHGSVVVMDPNTGQVMAMANLPSFDPDKYYQQSDYSAFQNAVVSSPYEAGSVVKTFTMATGLNEGVIKPESTYNDTGSVKIDDAVIRNVLQNVNGTRSMTEVFQYSLNTGVVWVLQQLGGGELNSTARQRLFGYFTNNYMFGKKTGIEQAGELAGQVSEPNTGNGDNVRYANMAFGQGMDTTMIQLAAGFSAMVNGGTYYKPTVVAGYVGSDGSVSKKAPQVVKSNVLKPDVSRELNDMMHVARTKSLVGQDKPGYYVAGKTGTAQVIDPKTGAYSDNNAIGSYLGFGGNSNSTPKYVIMVRVTDAKISSAAYAGGEAAAPIFANISNWLLDYLQVRPQ
jgi:cell division protein FtsI/penicillin-binding protein 2